MISPVQLLLSTFREAGLNVPESAAASGDLMSFIHRLTAGSTLRSWLKLLVIGWFLKVLQEKSPGLFSKVFAYIHKSTHISISLRADSSAYQWLMIWLSKQRTWSRARDLEVIPHPLGLKWDGLGPQRAEDNSDLQKLTYFPKKSEEEHHAWFRGHYITFKRPVPQYWYSYQILEVSLLARGHGVLQDLLREAQREYAAFVSERTSVYAVEGSGHWDLVCTRPKRPFESVILETSIKHAILQDALDFLRNKRWYTERGIPFRRGYLLHGTPGSGKTSIISALAGELGLDIYMVSLTKAGMDDATLNGLFSGLPERCIAIIEDIDVAVSGVLKRDLSGDVPAPAENSEAEKEKDTKKEVEKPAGKITLSGLLNALDGVGAQEGRILFATTNKLDALDKALTRPGRMDVCIEFKLTNRYQARELFLWFYKPREELSTKEDIKLSCSTADPLPSTITLLGALEARVGPVPASQLCDLAESFARILPEHQVSMAALQGYLMCYKSDPVGALENLAAWLAEQMRKEGRRPKSSSKSSNSDSSDFENCSTTAASESESEAASVKSA